MMTDLPPAWWIVKDEFHENRSLAQQAQSRAKGNPVVFLDTYQKPSKYWFYSNDTAFGLNTPTYRRNNFNYWPIEEHYNGRAAYVFGAYDKYFFNDAFVLRNGDKNGGRFIPFFYSFSKIFISQIESVSIDTNKISLQFTTFTPPEYIKLVQQAPYDTACVYLAVYRNKQVFCYLPSAMKVRDIKETEQHNNITIDTKLPRGNYETRLAISTCLPGRPSLNSAAFEVLIK